MSNFVAVVFGDRMGVGQGLQVLGELHQSGRITRHGCAIVQRSQAGHLCVERGHEHARVGLGVERLVSGLSGLFAARAGAPGEGTAAVQGYRELLRSEVSERFVADIQRELVPGKLAIMLELSEEALTHLDTRMRGLGGTIVRERWEEFLDDLIGELLRSRNGERAAGIETRGHRDARARGVVMARRRLEGPSARTARASILAEVRGSRA